MDAYVTIPYSADKTPRQVIKESEAALAPPLPLGQGCRLYDFLSPASNRGLHVRAHQLTFSRESCSTVCLRYRPGGVVLYVAYILIAAAYSSSKSSPQIRPPSWRSGLRGYCDVDMSGAPLYFLKGGQRPATSKNGVRP